MTTNYYDVLNVTKNSSIDDIKKSYRKLSMKYHPDKNNGEDTKMKQITEAYSIIGDPIKKKKYDFESTAPNPEDLINMFFGNTGNAYFSPDIFQNMSQGRNFQFFTNMQDNLFNNVNFVRPLVHTVNITLEEFYNNQEIKTTIKKTITTNNNSAVVNEEITITVPRTLLDTNCIILKNKGNVINNNKGDLKIKFILMDHHIFSLYKNDIIYCKEITLKDALCGFNFNINYIDGKKYKINNINTIISQSYKKEIENMGVFKNGERGKLIIMFKILFPEKLSLETKQALQELL
jgi:DnaJ-class molecular chaperone